jgi:hypothetical protein
MSQRNPFDPKLFFIIARGKLTTLSTRCVWETLAFADAYQLSEIHLKLCANTRSDTAISESLETQQRLVVDAILPLVPTK